MAARPVAERSTEVRSAREIIARLAFLLYVLALPGGLVALGFGLARGVATAVSVGISALLVFGLLHCFGRRALGFAAVRAELKRNPFKPRRAGGVPAASKEGCDDGSCGGL